MSASNTDLQKAISDALTTISGNGVANVVCSKWLGSAIDLSSLPVIEVSTSKASSAKTSDADESSSEKTGADGSASEDSSVSTDDGVEPKTEAGSNAVLPQGTSSAA
ncbi:MAG: hypothetical protein ACLRX5_02780 [Slackia sp.]